MNEFEILYREHASAVFRFAWGLCGDPGRAEDIVSETFVRLLTRAPRIRTRTALAYLLAVARNTYLTAQRKQKREVPLPEVVPAPVQDPAGLLENRARLETVLVALRGLPEGERAALLLRVDHDLTYEEVASALKISVGAAKVRVHRARLRLAKAMESQGREQHEIRSDP
jgi:RNA polymerase sigma-70 factor (ECF subfamily)